MSKRRHPKANYSGNVRAEADEWQMRWIAEAIRQAAELDGYDPHNPPKKRVLVPYSPNYSDDR